MKGKTGLIMGVANEKSIAWGIANELFLNKANIILSYQNDSLKKRIKPLAEKINCISLILWEIVLKYFFKAINKLVNIKTNNIAITLWLKCIT